MSQPEQPAGLDETLVDEGRTRRLSPRPPVGHADLDETLLDEGRVRPGAGTGDWPENGLPELLAARYQLIRRLERPALYLARVRADGTEVVIKRHRVDREPDSGLVQYLVGTHAHTVRYLEFEAGHSVTVYAAGGTLRERQQSNPSGFGLAELRGVVQQVSSALIELHRAGFVHRDVKPANIVRQGEDTTLIDFDIAKPLDGIDWPEQLNLAYQPPEWSNLGQVGAATDWWGLGMTVLELAAGQHPFAWLADEDIRSHFGRTRPVDVSGVPDDRLRNLCQGLLVTDPAERWGAENVGLWLVGRAPQPPRAAPSAAYTPNAAETPYQFRGGSYRLRDELAQAMTVAWNYTVRVLVERDGGLDGLRAWLDQFTDDDATEARRVVDGVATDRRESVHVRLLRVLRALDPTRPPVYRNHVISRRGLLAIAHRATANDGDDAWVLADLWNHRLLPEFDTAVPDDADTGGQMLAELDRSWIRASREWRTLVSRVTDPRAREHLRNTATDRERLAIWLRMALHQPEDLAAVQERLERAVAELPVSVPWFEAMVRQQTTVWAAELLSGIAISSARTEAQRIRLREAGEYELLISAAFREWSRRQNRPAALGWAVAGVCPVAVAWIALVTAADAANRVDDSVIGIAWVAASICLAVSLVAECMLAASIGGRFHVRYSIPGSGLLALRPLSRWMQRSWAQAAAAILAALAGITLVSIEFPQFLVIAMTIAHLVWVMRRWARWRNQVAVEEAQIAEAAQRQPSETDAVPAGAAGGADS
ncbi:serine/threonine protein kinase [Micromonospora sp. NPDC050784]|uniref:serine/threonine protein kinase n=1 Tax=Micromonospora sp. NPDC050784 TaxID=3364281 RepID=UPI0037AF6CE2